MRRGLQEIDFIKHPDAGDLRIGSSIVFDAGMLPAILQQFSTDFPRARLHVLHEDIATEQYDNLRNRSVELVLGRLPVQMNEADLIAEPWFDEPNVVAAALESPWARRRNLKLAELRDASWVMAQPGSLARAIQDETFRLSGVETPSASALTVSLHLYLRLIETGRWIGLVPASVMRFGGSQMRIKILPVKLSSPQAPVGIVTVKGRTLSPLAERFIACARRVAVSDAGRGGASGSRPRRGGVGE